jgi:hypothetical protein
LTQRYAFLTHLRERGEMPVAMGMQDPAAAGGGGHLRAGHDDRDRVTGLLKTAFTEGRLTGEELDARTGQALAARTYAELDALTEDIPGTPRLGGLPGSPVPSQASQPSQARPPFPVRRWRLARASAISTGCVALAFVLAYSGNLIDNAWQGPGPGPEDGWTRLLLVLALASVVTAFAVMGQALIATVEERGPRGQHPGTG